MVNNSYDILDFPFNQTDLPFLHKQTGKVRDIYSVDESKLLLVTTDRLSAFDRILGAVPYKGQVLNQLTAWWLETSEDIVANHMLAIPDPNIMLVQKAETFPVEVIVRGYITGVTTTALWYRYDLGEREIYGHHFPEGLKKNQQLPEPIITPTTKGGPGEHDERLTVAQVSEGGYLDQGNWDIVQKAALALFKRGQEVAKNAGLILVDTKYEFGRLPDGRVAVIDEVHTPDSSRFWLADSFQDRFAAGEEPENYDKEFLRLAYANQGYRGEGEPPEMPKSLWQQVSDRYIDLYERLTKTAFDRGVYPVESRMIDNLKKAGLI